MKVTFPDGTVVHVHDVIILSRLSKKATGHAKTGIYSQDIDAREWAEDQAFNVVQTVADHISGVKAMWDRKNARPWVTQPDLMAKYQMIVVAKHDRLSRADWRDEGDIRRWAEDNHKVLYLTEQDLRWPPREHDANDRQRWNNEAEQSRREWESTSKRYKRMQRYRRENNYLSGRPIYGYRVVGVNCQESPCQCYELRRDEDFKTLKIHEPEAVVIREAKNRYLAGESLKAICDDFNQRHIASPMWRGKPGTHWYVNTLADLLRNPGIAGRRYPRKPKGEITGKPDKPPILRYKGIITWQEHEQLVARLDSRANRKGISPGNVSLLTGILHDEAGHPMWHDVGGAPRVRVHNYRCYKGCKFMIHVDKADAEVARKILEWHGDDPAMTLRIIPASNNYNRIAELRQQRAELDDTADDYDQRHADITAEIRRLIKEDEEHPKQDEAKWVKTGKTIAQEWADRDTAGRRDWLKANGWKVIAYSDGRIVPVAGPVYALGAPEVREVAGPIYRLANPERQTALAGKNDQDPGNAVAIRDERAEAGPRWLGGSTAGPLVMAGYPVYRAARAGSSTVG